MCLHLFSDSAAYHEEMAYGPKDLTQMEVSVMW